MAAEPVPIDLGSCDECNLCCVLNSGVKEYTRLKDGVPVPVSCTRLWWQCTCPGGTLVLQRKSGAVWVDIPVTGNSHYPTPFLIGQTYRLKCSTNDLVYYSNEVAVAAAEWTCDCQQAGVLKKVEIAVDLVFYPESGDLGGTSGPPISVTVYSVDGVFDGSYGVSGSFTVTNRTFGGTANGVSCNLIGGMYSATSACDDILQSSSEWRLLFGDGSPCPQDAPCNSGSMALDSSTGDGRYFGSNYTMITAGGLGDPCLYWQLNNWTGYAEIVDVRVELIDCE